jgi:hypothetical protein
MGHRRSTVLRTVTVVLGVAVVAGIVIALIPSESGYHDTALGTAHDGLSAVRTLALLSTADQDRRLLPTYRSVSADDAVTKLTNALRQLESADIPGPSSAALHDRLDPILQTAVRQATAVRDAMQEPDSAKATAAAEPLRATGDQLAEFVRSNQ